MDEATFTAFATAAGCKELYRTAWAPHHGSTEHSHDFNAHGLILKGAFTLTTRQGSQILRAGDTFSLNADSPHFETASAGGVEFLAGRATPGAA
ncbi:MAG: cupin domain-containing protein [Gammaproteobacteria bacterium]|nr:cupin domain-containing protein [Gammaproteobacteria bacterium]